MCKDIDEEEVELYMKIIENSWFGKACNYLDKLVDALCKVLKS